MLRINLNVQMTLMPNSKHLFMLGWQMTKNTGQLNMNMMMPEIAQCRYLNFSEKKSYRMEFRGNEVCKQNRNINNVSIVPSH